MRIVVKANIQNIETSRLLEEVAAAVESRGLGMIKLTTSQVPGTKGITLAEIVVQLALGAAGNAAYELIKALVSRGIDRYKASGLTDDSISIVAEPDNSGGLDSKSE